MFTALYPITYILSLSTLLAWFYFQEKETLSSFVSKLFFGSFLTYLFSLSLSDGTLNYKFFVVGRDLFTMGFIAFLFSLFRKNTLFFFAMLAGLYGLFATKGASVLEQTFPQQQEDIASVKTDIELARDGELLVELKASSFITDIGFVLESYGITYEKAFSPASASNLEDYYLLNIPDRYQSQVAAIQKALNRTGFVEWVEQNEVVRLSPLETSSTTETKKQFGINDPDLSQLWGFDVMDVDVLYKGLSKNKIKPKSKALIAILDTGVDATHEDLAANFKSIDEQYDTDSRGHGTHCAGIAAAVSNNKLGIASFAPSNQFVQVTSIQVLSGFGVGTQKRIIDGMILAADSGADVISMSLGGMNSASKQKAYEDVVDYCTQKGAIVVVAAGNSNKDARDFSPANLADVITVTAIDPDLNRATFSNYVTDIEMTLAAPGVDIYSTIPGDKYATFSGTSMATPYVSGLIGVLKSIQPDLTAKEVHKILHQSGKDTRAVEETGRLIQPAKALELVID